jgi:protein-S-isoprenylcysteine O-methyltransferase Ste14
MGRIQSSATPDGYRCGYPRPKANRGLSLNRAAYDGGDSHRRVSVRRIAAVYSLIAVYIASERFLRQGKAATSLEGADSDQGSTRAIGTALGISSICLLVAPILSSRKVAVLPRRGLLFWVGMSAMITGLVVRSWANRVLGASYTRTLRIVQEQRVMQEGPYHLVRHPGYLGTLLVWLGAAVALGNWVIMTAAGIVMLRAYRRRIETEERMLLDNFGDEYRRYMRRTRRLVPLLY